MATNGAGYWGIGYWAFGWWETGYWAEEDVSPTPMTRLFFTTNNTLRRAHGANDRLRNG